MEKEEKLIDPQPKGQAPISGYHKMTESDIDAINRVKAMGASVEELMLELKDRPNVDQRWLQLANDNIQTGLMQATRSIAKPNTYA